MMFTHDFDHPLYSTRWALSDWFQFLFENTVLSGGFASVLIKILFRISRVYQTRWFADQTSRLISRQ